MTKLSKLLALLRQMGLRRSIHVLYIAWIEPLVMEGLPAYARCCRIAMRLRRKVEVDAAIAKWSARRAEVLEIGRLGYHKRIHDLWTDPKALSKAKFDPSSQGSLIADIDQDGLLLSHVGPLPMASTISPEMFVPRTRFDLKVIDHGGTLAVRKNFRGNRFAFVNELDVAHQLAVAGCNVPAILDFDVSRLTITYSYIVGDVLREALVEHGALLRDRDTELLPGHELMSTRQKHHEQIRQGVRVLNRVVDADLVEQLFSQLQKIHSAGYVLHDIKYGNIILEAESRDPYFIDFDWVMGYPEMSKLVYRFLRDDDYLKFNQHFGTEKLTYARVRELMKRERPDHLARFYAPILIKGGVKFGSIQQIGVSHGRWHYILKDNLPALKGKRVLDLGPNNGYIALEMLRAGAREVCAIEPDESAIAQGHFVKELFGWADNREYNLRYVREDMSNAPHIGLGKFDLITALCSLYYLDDDSIVALVQELAKMSDTLVIQCNIDRTIPRPDPAVFYRASVEYGVNVLQENGFPVTKIVAPPGYVRPLVVGKTV